MVANDKQLTDEALGLIATRFRMLSDQTRLRLLHLLSMGEMTVTQLVEASGSGQANVSKHLGMLTDAGIVARRKEGLNVYYRIADESIFELCNIVCNSLGDRFAAHRAALKGYAGE